MLRRVAACCELKNKLVRMLWRNIVARTWPNDYNNKQHPQMLREKFDVFQIWGNDTQHVATSRNMVAINARSMLRPTQSRSQSPRAFWSAPRHGALE